jgi:hypothetical protein
MIYRIEATNSYSEQETCEHCGRTGLKRTRIVNLVDTDGMIWHKMAFGTTCATKLASGKTDGVRYAEFGETL